MDLDNALIGDRMLDERLPIKGGEKKELGGGQ